MCSLRSGEEQPQHLGQNAQASRPEDRWLQQNLAQRARQTYGGVRSPEVTSYSYRGCAAYYSFWGRRRYNYYFPSKCVPSTAPVHKKWPPELIRGFQGFPRFPGFWGFPGTGPNWAGPALGSTRTRGKDDGSLHKLPQTAGLCPYGHIFKYNKLFENCFKMADGKTGDYFNTILLKFLTI